MFVPKAEKLNVAYATYERAGCYACHKTRGFENLRKPGPILTKIDSKLTPGLGEDLDSQSAGGEADHLDAARLVQLELQLAGGRGPQRSRDQRGRRVSLRERRDARARGQEPAARRRASAASRSSSRSAAWAATSSTRRRAPRPGRTAPSASRSQNIGNKTTYEWIYNWVRDPKHYSPDTYMPDLRLTDAQVADVATYLSS